MKAYDNDDLLLSRRQVEERFGISMRFLEIAAVKGGGPVMIKVGRNVRYRIGDIRDWIESRRVRSTSDQPAGLAS